MVVLWLIEVLTEACVALIVVLGAADVEVTDPAEFAVYITVLSDP